MGEDGEKAGGRCAVDFTPAVEAGEGLVCGALTEARNYVKGKGCSEAAEALPSAERLLVGWSV